MFCDTYRITAIYTNIF